MSHRTYARVLYITGPSAESLSTRVAIEQTSPHGPAHKRAGSFMPEQGLFLAPYAAHNPLKATPVHTRQNAGTWHS